MSRHWEKPTRKPWAWAGVSEEMRAPQFPGDGGSLVAATPSDSEPSALSVSLNHQVTAVT